MRVAAGSDRLGQALPHSMPRDSDIEIRQIYQAEDLGAALTPELRELEERVRA